jgi:hypothetical protein
MSLEKTVVTRDSYVDVQRAEAEERRARAGLFRALRVAVWLAIWSVAVPLFLLAAAGAGVGIRLLMRGAS